MSRIGRTAIDRAAYDPSVVVTWCSTSTGRNVRSSRAIERHCRPGGRGCSRHDAEAVARPDEIGPKRLTVSPISQSLVVPRLSLSDNATVRQSPEYSGSYAIRYDTRAAIGPWRVSSHVARPLLHVVEKRHLIGASCGFGASGGVPVIEPRLGRGPPRVQRGLPAISAVCKEA